ncbi:Nucleotidyltransferase [Pyrococcus sp. NA2]|uniref:nucleotidyltransferase domain-containing protein n=1 Tax=Pyrococcus sp. (strain NA2) TaxID=342949 RepID=UPI000209AF51|nr:nucleotidyltransferase domain-containing protein [Pyrococcus sp. NA2]AEC51126.1 Nucleotidyltransferase [Pyrococcus sp. NA2]
MKIEDPVGRMLTLDKEGENEFIIPYGSHARGEARKDIDVDLCIYHGVTKSEVSEFRIRVLGELSDNYDVQISSLLLIFLKKECLKGVVLFYREWKFLCDIAYKSHYYGHICLARRYGGMDDGLPFNLMTSSLKLSKNFWRVQDDGSCISSR